MKNTKYIIIGLFFITPLLTCYSQSNSPYFYYYKGSKIFLEPDQKAIAITSSAECGNTTELSLSIMIWRLLQIDIGKSLIHYEAFKPK